MNEKETSKEWLNQSKNINMVGAGYVVKEIIEGCTGSKNDQTSSC